MNGFPNNMGSRSTKRTDTVKKKQGLGALYMREDLSTRKIIEAGLSERHAVKFGKKAPGLIFFKGPF